MSAVENGGTDVLSTMHGIMNGMDGNVLNSGAPAMNSTAGALNSGANATGVGAIAPAEQSESNVVLVSEQDGIQESLDKMFAAVLVGGLNSKIAGEAEIMTKKAEVFKQALNRFLTEFNTNIFEDEYAVLYSALNTLNVKVFSINQLYTIISNSSDDILGSDKIHLDKYNYNNNGGATTDDEKLMAFRLDVGDKFRELSTKVVTLEEFDTACSIYKMNFREQYMAQVSQAMAVIMTDGLHEKVGKGRNRIWKGADDCREYYSLKVGILDSIESNTGVTDSVIDEDWYSEELEEENNGTDDVLLDTGIEEIDRVYEGMIRGNMFEVMGPPKGGKTTLIQWLCDRGLERGLNVAVWALEGTKAEWLAAFTSLIVRKREGINISKRRVLKRIYRDERERQAVLAAKAELALNIKRGKLSFIEKACYVENMRSDLDNHWKNINAFDIIAMDSPILALSLRGKSKTDAAAEAYTTLKHYVSYELPTKALALVTCQMKQEVIDNIRSNPEAEIDVTAGGVTAETIRTPDFVTCLVSTKQERKMGQVKVCDVASRHTESFDSFYVHAELGCCYFQSDASLNEV